MATVSDLCRTLAKLHRLGQEDKDMRVLIEQTQRELQKELDKIKKEVPVGKVPPP